MTHLLWLALAIPVIVHLVHRRKAKVLPFSTLYFLRRLDQRVARRQKLRELLLLAARILLLAALIGALERPILRTANFRGRAVATTAAILLDNTYSMQASDQGTTRFARARDAALQVLDGLKDEDAAVVELMDAAGAPAEPATSDIGGLRRGLNALSCGYGTGEISAPLRRVRQALAGNPNPAKEVYILTDLQGLCWPDGLAEALAEWPKDVPVYLVDVGGPVEQNLAIAETGLGRKVNVAGTATAISCRLLNTGARGAAGKLSLFISGEKVAEQDVSLAAGGQQTAVFHYAFPKPGLYGGWVEVSADGLPADNRGYFSAEILEQLPALIVNGDPSLVPSRDGAFFLRLALECGMRDGQRLSPIKADVVADTEFNLTGLERYACIVLSNVARLDDRQAQALTAYVQRGGGLFIFCGDRVDPAAYNVAFEQANLLPAMLMGPTSAGAGVEADAGTFFRIQNTDAGHPALRDISAEIDFGSTQITRMLATQTPEDGKGFSVLMTTEAGPLLLDRRFGSGEVILCTSSATPAWSNMPLKPYFLPLMHQLIYYMSRTSGETLNGVVGAPFALTLKAADKPTPVKITPPPTEDGKISPLTLRSEFVARENRALLRDTARPGIYRAEYDAAGGAMARHVVINVEARESDLAKLSLDEAAARLNIPNVVKVSQPEKLSEVVRVERQGLPLWDYLLAAALVLAVIETFMANVFVKH